MLKLLDEILLSDNVVKNFYDNYKNLEFKQWLNSILPEIEDCRVTNQDNPWHIYTCLDHILHSVECMNRQTVNFKYDVRRMLAYTMLLHDIGKPESKIRRYSKLYNREVDSFFNHNLASVKIGKRVLGQLGFDNNDKQMILKLVEEHDAFIPFTLDNSVDKHKELLTKAHVEELVKRLDINNNGLQMMKYLVMVGRSDNSAQNPNMTAQSLKLLDVTNGMLDEINEKDL
jgi:UTP:GlnB (protein PII) uridylyltransferase